MLVIITNYTTDGTSAIHQRRCLPDLRSGIDMAASASCAKATVINPRATGFVFTGDILTPIRSTRWLEEADGTSLTSAPERPRRPPICGQIRAITRAILQENENR
jgi:hypothetical protein